MSGLSAHYPTFRIETLTAEIADRNEQITSLSQDISEKASQIGSLTEDVENKSKQIETLTADADDKAKQIEVLTTDTKDKAEQIEALTADAENKAEQIEALTADAENKAEQIEALTADVENKAGQIEALTADAEDKAGQIEALTADAKDKAEQIEALTADTEDKARQIETLTAENAEKATIIQALNAENATQAIQIDRNKTDFLALTEQGEKDKEELNRQAQLIDELKAQAEADAAKIQELEDRLTLLNTQTDTMNPEQHENNTSQDHEKPLYRIAGELTTLDTGHFTVSVPKTWVNKNLDGWHYYYATQDSSVSRGFLAVAENHSLVDVVPTDEKEIKDILSQIIKEISSQITNVSSSEIQGPTEFVKLNGLDGIICRLRVSDELFANLILVFDRGNLLAVAYADESYDSQGSLATAKEYFNTIASKEDNSTAQDVISQAIYPKRFTSTLKDYAKPLPDVCYSTPGSENGCQGLPCYVTGTVTKVYAEGEYSKTSPQMIFLDTDKGPVFFMVYSPDFLLKSNSDASRIVKTLADKKQYYSLFDTTMDYTMPSVGEEVCIYGVYSGYSNALNRAALNFGLDNQMYEFLFGTFSPDAYDK